MSPRERLGYATVTALLLFGFGYAGAQHLRQPTPIVFKQESGGNREQKVAASVTPSEVVVHVVGEVKKPGLVTLPPTARVNDAIQAAGGATSRANVDGLNLAAKLIDGTQLRVPIKLGLPAGSLTKSRVAQKPRREIPLPPLKVDIQPVGHPSYTATGVSPYAPGTSNYEKAPAPEHPKGSKPEYAKKAPQAVWINTASAEELQKLPGVGAVTAAKIVELRDKAGPFGSVDALLAVKGIGPKKLEQMRPYVKL